MAFPSQRLDKLHRSSVNVLLGITAMGLVATGYVVYSLIRYGGGSGVQKPMEVDSRRTNSSDEELE